MKAMWVVPALHEAEDGPVGPGISSGKLANLANSVSEKIEAGTDVSSDWSRGFPSRSLRYRL